MISSLFSARLSMDVGDSSINRELLSMISERELVSSIDDHPYTSLYHNPLYCLRIEWKKDKSVSRSPKREE